MVTQDSFVRQVHVGGGRDGSDDNWQFAMGDFNCFGSSEHC